MISCYAHKSQSQTRTSSSLNDWRYYTKNRNGVCDAEDYAEQTAHTFVYAHDEVFSCSIEEPRFYHCPLVDAEC